MPLSFLANREFVLSPLGLFLRTVFINLENGNASVLETVVVDQVSQREGYSKWWQGGLLL